MNVALSLTMNLCETFEKKINSMEIGQQSTARTDPDAKQIKKSCKKIK